MPSKKKQRKRPANTPATIDEPISKDDGKSEIQAMETDSTPDVSKHQPNVNSDDIVFDFTEPGRDTEGRAYNNLQEMWEFELKDKKSREQTNINWYAKADEYWKSIQPDIDGMLGGFASISKEDVKTSTELLKEFFDGTNGPKVGKTRALDCGAGIGRVTKNLLVPLFESVDLLEQNSIFVEKAKEYLEHNPKVKNYFCSGMQEFKFGENKYDVIWMQWVTGHLTDIDFISFLRRCHEALLPNGIIIIKDNNSSQGFVVDRQDSSLTRSDNHFRALIKATGLPLIKVKLQPKFPKDLFPVRMYALR